MQDGVGVGGAQVNLRVSAVGAEVDNPGAARHYSPRSGAEWEGRCVRGGGGDGIRVRLPRARRREEQMERQRQESNEGWGC